MPGIIDQEAKPGTGTSGPLPAQCPAMANDLRSQIGSAFPALAALEPDAAEMLHAAARAVTIPAGQVLFRDGAECGNYVLVLEGVVRVQKTAESGREIVLYRVESGQTCVLTTNCLITRANYSAEGIAEAAVRAAVLPASGFRALLAHSQTFRDFVFSAFAIRIADLLLLIEEVAFNRIDTRLAAWLANRHGKDGIRATHREIALELGTAREVVSRQLKDFERRGWVTLHRGMLEVLDARALRRLAEQM